MLVRAMAQGGAPAYVTAYQQRAIRAAVGGPVHDSLDAIERDMFDRTNAARGAAFATSGIQATLSFVLRLPRSTWPALDTTVRDPKLRPAIALSRGDTAALRKAADDLERLLRGIVTSGSSDTAYAVIASDAYLALGDTAAALRIVRYALDTAASTTTYFPLNSQGFTAASFAPRLMLLRADLAGARGHRDEARVWYDRFIDMWSTAVPELQAVVRRARQARAALGPSAD